MAHTIKTETKVGGNTADRVGSAFEGVADALEGTEQIAEMDKAVQEVQQQVEASKAQIQSLVNALPVVQQTGDSTTSVMSQKAVTDAIQAEIDRATAAEIDIIYDVSARNSGAVFESLSALLSSSNLSTLIPTSVRHGGMSIRFIQGSVSSSGNTYVQYRLMNQNWSTVVTDWQGVDDEPTARSNNLVKSGGVKDLFDRQYGETTADFAISDENDTEIVRFENGHIKTKNFDSEITNEKNIEVVNNDETFDLSFKDEEGHSLVQFQSGHIKTKKFYSKDALERISQLEYNHIIYCVGDSITQGQTGIVSPTDDEEQVNRYPDKLKVMVGDDFEVVNLGVGGQKPNEIFARMGWLDLLTNEDFTLPADTSLVAAPSFIGSNDAMDANNFMQQGLSEAIKQMSRCWMNGVECAMSYSNGTLYINRVTATSKSTFFPSGTNVTFSGEKGVGIYLLYIGQNGMQKDDANLFLGEVKAATSRISGKFLVLGLFTSSLTYKTKFDACNALLQKEFGSRYVDPQYICSQQALDDLGYTPTTDSDITQDRYDHGVRSDVYQMENGLVPSSFWRYSWTSNYQQVDCIHLNSLGYTAMARMFYNKMKALKWI